MVANCKHVFSSKEPTSNCELKADTSGFCPLHNPDAKKEQGTFEGVLAEVLHNKTRDRFDFRDTIFIETTFFKQKSLDVYADFRGARFLNGATFEGTVFQGDSNFTSAQFEQNANFHKTYFGPHATFVDCKFLNQVVLSNCRFIGKATFSSCRFEEAASFDGSEFDNTMRVCDCSFGSDLTLKSIKANNQFSLLNCDCHGDIDFECARMLSPWSLEKVTCSGILNLRRVSSSVSAAWKNITIPRDAEMRLAEASFAHDIGFVECHFTGRCVTEGLQLHHRIQFDHCDLTALQFLPVLEQISIRDSHQSVWPRRKVFGFLLGQISVAEAKTPSDASRLLRFYRTLQKDAYDRGDYPLASDAYVSFMVMKRKASKNRKLACVFDWIYEKLSSYGESITRPLCTLIVLWLVCSTLLLHLGIELHETEGLTQRNLFGGEGFFLTAEFFQTFFLNFLLSTLLRVGESRPDAVSWQSLIVVVETLMNALLISFLFIGVRRHFNPRKPILEKELS